MVYASRVSDTADPETVIRQSLDAAREAPIRVRALCEGLESRDAQRRPGVGKLSVLEHLLHLRDMEREVFGERLRRILDEDHPTLGPVRVEDHELDDATATELSASHLLDEWAAARAENISRVEATGAAEWQRQATHAHIGAATFADVVRRWARHDADHVRQIEILAMNSRERDLG